MPVVDNAGFSTCCCEVKAQPMGKHWHVCAIVSGKTGGGFEEAGVGGMLLRSGFFILCLSIDTFY